MNAMDVRNFEEALDRWGSNLSDWPAAERQAAEALLVRSKDVQTLLEAERRIDSAFSALREHAVSSRLEQRILARLPASQASPAAGSDQPQTQIQPQALITANGYGRGSPPSSGDRHCSPGCR